MEWTQNWTGDLSSFSKKGALIIAFLTLGWTTGCENPAPEALGTLEWDQVHGRAVASQPIIEILVQEGEGVSEGQPILQIDPSIQQSEVARLEAQVQQAAWQLKQFEAGYREEEIASAEAEVEGARINRETRQIEFDREQELFERNATTAQRVEINANALAQAKAQERSADERLRLLRAGYRAEEIEQARSGLAAAQAQLELAKTQLERYTVKAEREGVLDSLPFKLGDKPPSNAVVTTVLAGSLPWARVYLPQPWLSRVEVGQEVDLLMDGQTKVYRGRIRHIAANASFTPYYTLSEADRSRLSYVTEIDLIDDSAGELPVGLPVRMRLNDAKASVQ